MLTNHVAVLVTLQPILVPELVLVVTHAPTRNFVCAYCWLTLLIRAFGGRRLGLSY